MANENVTTEELRRRLKKFSIDANVYEGKPGLLGRADGTLYADSTSRDRVWVRLGEGTGNAYAEIIARINGIPRQLNLPVIVVDRNGIPTVLRVDTDRAAVFSDSRPIEVPEHAASHGRFGNDVLLITGPSFLPIMCRPSNTAGLTVTVESGFYRYGGTEKAFPQTVSGSFAAYLPAPTRQTFVVLYLNRATNALGIQASGVSIVSAASVAPFTTNDVLTSVGALVTTVSEAVEVFPIAAIRMYAGQTRIAAQDIFMDLRPWGGEVGAINPLNDPTNGDDFNVSGNLPTGWVDAFPASEAYVADGYWKLFAGVADTEVRYWKQTAFTLESANKYVMFGPILLSDDRAADDFTWYFSLHSGAGAVHNSSPYVHIALNWDSAGVVWKCRMESYDGAGGYVNGSWFTFPYPPLMQPLYFSFIAYSTREFRGYVGHAPFGRSFGPVGQMFMGQIDLSATAAWGQFWVEIDQLRGVGTVVGSEMWLGGVDYA